MDMSSYNSTKMPERSKITTYQAGVVQAAMHRKLQKKSDEILKPYSLTKMHWLMIGTILDAGKKGIRISDLAKILDTTMGYLTNNLKVLEARGIVNRIDSTSDSRSRLVIVAPTFVPKCVEIENALREGLRKTIYTNVDPKEFKIYMKVMFELNKVDD
jgi:DNA-binding MarR family transcriptional regulator